MNTKITIKNQKILNETKTFLTQYLSQKNREIGPKIYLSFYLSEDTTNAETTRAAKFSKILREAELSLKSQLNSKIAGKMLEQLNKINPIEIVRDSKMSIAFFVSEHFAGFVLVPFPVFENVIVAQSLHLKPILPWIKSGDRFYLITLSSKTCRLLKGDSFSLTEINTVTLPNDETRNIKKMSAKNNKLKLLSQAEQEFYQVLKNDAHPIIIGGVNELHDLYKTVNRDPDLLKERIVGNLDRSSFEDLHDECLKILNTIRSNNDANILLTFQDLKPYGKVIDELNEITIAAIQGRVRNLMVASDRFLWGHLDKTSGKITNQLTKNLAVPEDDILDDLAEIVMSRGGDVTLLKHNEMPTDRKAMALLK